MPCRQCGGWESNEAALSVAESCRCKPFPLAAPHWQVKLSQLRSQPQYSCWYCGTAQTVDLTMTMQLPPMRQQFDQQGQGHGTAYLPIWAMDCWSCCHRNIAAVTVRYERSLNPPVCRIVGAQFRPLIAPATGVYRRLLQAIQAVRFKSQVPVYSAIHDTDADEEIIAAQELQPSCADDELYDGSMAHPDAGGVIFLAVTPSRLWVNNRSTDQWYHKVDAFYPRTHSCGHERVVYLRNGQVGRLTLDLAEHLPLHTNRFSLYFVHFHVPPSNRTVQAHIVALDNYAANAATRKKYYDIHAVRLPKLINSLFYYDPRVCHWWHPEHVHLAGGLKMPLYINVAVTNSIPLPGNVDDIWSRVFWRTPAERSNALLQGRVVELFNQQRLHALEEDFGSWSLGSGEHYQAANCAWT